MAKKEIDIDLDEKENEGKEETKKSGSSNIKIIIIAIVLTLVVGGGLVGGTLYFMSGMDSAPAASKKADSNKVDSEDEEEADDEDEDEGEEDEDEGDGEEDEEGLTVPTEPAMYYSLDPKFVVSFSNQEFARFMQFSLEVMSRDAEVIKKIEQHNPVIRSNLLMLFSSQNYNEMISREGKEKLLKETAADINNTLRKVTGDSKMSKAVEAAYFTSFVIQ